MPGTNGNLRVANSIRITGKVIAKTAKLVGLLVTFAPCAPLFALPTALEGVRVGPSPERTRVVFDLGGPVEYCIMKDAGRLIVVIENALLKESLGELDIKGTPIASVLPFRGDDNDLQMVLDLNKEVEPKGFLLGPRKQYGHRLVIDLYPVSSRSGPVMSEAVQCDRDGSRVASGREETLARKAEPVAGQMRDLLVVIDAGHGGKDPGAIGLGKLMEKKVVLEIAKILAGLFEKEPGFAPKLTREGDEYIALQERTEMAWQSQADAFLSIHADAFRNRQVSGASVYLLPEKCVSDEATCLLANKRNQAGLADVDASGSFHGMDDPLAEVLRDVRTSASRNSRDMGRLVLDALGRVTKLRKKTLGQARFAVLLKSLDIPSLLIETGYISNPEEEKKLATRSHREKLAKAIFLGVRDYLTQRPPPGSYLAWLRASQGDGPRTHTIVKGDTLSAIASRYHVSPHKIKEANGLRGDIIRVGQKLTIPPT